MRFRAVIATASVVALSLAVTNAASAACTRLSFSVNDYGKDGPTKDAKNLLDKYAAKWTADRGIKKFSVGQKEVSCELFLNFVVFDEHTCTATANVCWDGAAAAPIKDAKAETPFVNNAATAAAKPARAAPAAAAAAGAATSPVATGSVKPAPAAARAPASATAKAPAAAAPAAVVPVAAPKVAVPAAAPAVAAPAVPVAAPVVVAPAAPPARVVPQAPAMPAPADAAPAGGN